MKTQWIALVRGIPNDPTSPVRSEEIPSILAAHGLENVSIVQEPGNILFSSEKEPKELEKLIPKAFRETWQLRVKVVVVSAESFRKIAADNPCSGADPETVHILFLRRRPVTPNFQQMERFKTSEEKWSLSDEALYLVIPGNFYSSQLAVRAERLIGVNATKRTQREVEEILRALEA